MYRTSIRLCPYISHSLLESCTSKSSEVDLCTSSVLSAQSELSRLRKEVTDLEGQVPQLTDSKKAAVTGVCVCVCVCVCACVCVCVSVCAGGGV